MHFQHLTTVSVEDVEWPMGFQLGERDSKHSFFNRIKIIQEKGYKKSKIINPQIYVECFLVRVKQAPWKSIQSYLIKP